MKMLHTLRKSPEDSAYIETGEEDIVSEDGRFVSEEEYWEKYYDDPDFIYEWKNGRPEVRPMSDVKGSRMYGRVTMRDALHALQNGDPEGAVRALRVLIGR